MKEFTFHLNTITYSLDANRAKPKVNLPKSCGEKVVESALQYLPRFRS